MKKISFFVGMFFTLSILSAPLFAETTSAPVSTELQMSDRVLQDMTEMDLSRRISQLTRTINSLERKVDRLDGKVDQLNHDLKELKRKV